MGCNTSATIWRSRASISSIDTPASALGERLAQGPLDPLTERYPGLAGCGRHRLAGRLADAADRPASGQTGSLPPSPAYALTLKAALSFGQGSSMGDDGRGDAGVVSPTEKNAQ